MLHGVLILLFARSVNQAGVKVREVLSVNVALVIERRRWREKWSARRSKSGTWRMAIVCFTKHRGCDWSQSEREREAEERWSASSALSPSSSFSREAVEAPSRLLHPLRRTHLLQADSCSFVTIYIPYL